jgi:hypothetical protein
VRREGGVDLVRRGRPSVGRGRRVVFVHVHVDGDFGVREGDQQGRRAPSSVAASSSQVFLKSLYLVK